jgi:squalene-associated FAD-dependent desaturase
MTIDNGTHLVLSGNASVLSFLETIGAESGLHGPADAEFPFADMASGERWTLRIGEGRIPWWVFDKTRRVPQTSLTDYLPLARLLYVSADRPLEEVMTCAGPLYDRLLHPLLLAALNIAPAQGSSRLAAALIRETLAQGGKACRPLLAQDGLGKVFIAPAVEYLQSQGVSIRFENELQAVRFLGKRVAQLEFAGGTETIGKHDAVILALPPHAAKKLVPSLPAPTEFRGIANAHFRIDPPADMPPMLGVINGTCEWIFALPGRIAVTVSDAERLFDAPRAELAARLWREVAKLTGLPETLPPWQIVRERRATFAATPEQNALRPSAETAWHNFFLAGDWTATGLPATLEGAIRSGFRAADLVSHAIRAAA